MNDFTSEPETEVAPKNFEEWKQSVVGLSNKEISEFIIQALPWKTDKIPVSLENLPLNKIFSTVDVLYGGEKRELPGWVLEELDEKVGTELRQIAKDRLERGMQDPARLGFACFTLLHDWGTSIAERRDREMAMEEQVEQWVELQEKNERFRKMTEEERERIRWEERLRLLDIKEVRDDFFDYLRYSSENTTYDRFLELDGYLLAKFKDKGIKLLDAGCSFGAMTERFARLLPRAIVVGLDIYQSPKATLLRADYVRGDILDPPFQRSPFDVIVLSRVLDHFTPDGIEKAIEITKNLLIDGGEVLIGPFFQDQNKRWTEGIFLCCRKENGNLMVKDTIVTKETSASF